MNLTEYLLNCLAEEAAEVAQIAMKSTRFRLDDRQHDGGATAGERLMHEINDVLAVLELVSRHQPTLPYAQLGNRAAMDAKQARVLHYMQHSVAQGTLSQEAMQTARNAHASRPLTHEQRAKELLAHILGNPAHDHVAHLIAVFTEIEQAGKDRTI